MNWVTIFLIFAAAALLITAVLLLRIVIYLWNGHPRRLSGEICSSCAYTRQGLETLACPECGTVWGPVARARTPAWVELGLLVSFLLMVLLVLPGFVILGIALFS